MILDTHLHIWDTSQVQVSWLAEAGHRPVEPVPEDHPAQDRQYILVEANADDHSAESQWLITQVQTDQRVYGAVIGAAIETPEGRDAVTTLARRSEVVGVRRLLQDSELYETNDLIEGLKAVAASGLPFDACSRAWELPRLLRVVEQFPALTIVLDHMGKPPVSEPRAMHQWEGDLRRLAEHPNVHCKLSGLPAECADQAQLEQMIEPVVSTALGLFGPERCLVGSDSPVSADQRDWCAQVLDLVDPAHRAAIAATNAHRIYTRS